MGKASSAKKVARAARAGGVSRRERPKLGFPAAIFTIMVLGAFLVFFARTSHEDTAGAEQAPSYTKRDHWHAAYGFYVCDHFLPNLPESPTDPLGVHTHGDGVMHIHPSSAASSGSKARFKVFNDANNVSFIDQGFKLADGKEYKASDGCNGKPAKMAVYKWKVEDPSAPIEVYESNFDNINFANDHEAYTVAILPEGVEQPPQPETASNLEQLGAVDGGGSSSGQPELPGQPDLGGVTPSSTPGAPTPSDPTPSIPTPGDPTPSVPDPAPVNPTPSSTP